MQLVLMNNNSSNLHDRPISAGAAAAAAAQVSASLNTNALASETSTSELNSTTTTSTNANASNSSDNDNGELTTKYLYKDYSNVSDLEGIEGYNSDSNNNNNYSPNPNQAAVAAATATTTAMANPAAAVIHDAHTMRLQKFPAKLESILSRPEWSDIVTWMPHGRSWKILKPHDFETLIMPLYFDHCNYHSFNRLVNAWSFRRMSSGPDRGSYYHELFLRGRPNLHRMMRRLPKSQKKAPMSKQDEPDFYSMPKMDALVPNNNPGTSPAALAAAAAMPAASVSMSAKTNAAQAMAAAAGLGINMNMNMSALASGLGGHFAATTNDVGQLSLMGLQQSMGMGMGSMLGNQNNFLGMNNTTNTNNMGRSTNDNGMDSNAAIQAAMTSIAQQQLAERAQMSSLLGMGASEHTNNVFQQQSSLQSNDPFQSQSQMQQQLSDNQSQQHQQDQQQQQQDFTPNLEANLFATQLEHDRLQQQIAALQAQQQAIANEQLHLQQFQQQAASVNHQMQQQFQQNAGDQFQQLNEALQAQQQETKMSSPVLGAARSTAADADSSTIEQVANSPVAKSG